MSIMISSFFENSQSPKVPYQKNAWAHKLLQIIIKGSSHPEGWSFESIFPITAPSLK